MEEFDFTVIGAGIVGLAAASQIASPRGIVIERHNSFGRETSGRNSEVIHAGIYYPRGSLKAGMCVEGNKLIYRICRENGINCRKTGKIIAAVNSREEKKLAEICRQGIDNGAGGLRIISGKDIKRMEPDVEAAAGIYSPETGIVDSHGLMKHFEKKAKAGGVTFAYGCELTEAEKNGSGYILSIRDTDGSIYRFKTAIIINCAGLGAPAVSAMLGIAGYRLYYCKGEYFSITGKTDISRLIYPCPTDKSLGIHTVIDLGGRLKLGPNAFYVDKIDYTVDAEHARSMRESAARYLPKIRQKELTPDMAGIRPKLQPPGGPVKDFIIRREETGVSGILYNLIGIESPGLTSAPAIARYIARAVKTE